MANEPVDIASKERMRQTYHTTVSQLAPQLNNWQVTLLLCFNCNHVLPVNHCQVQMIVSMKY